jgi:hypothetical protein
VTQFSWPLLPARLHEMMRACGRRGGMTRAFLPVSGKRRAVWQNASAVSPVHTKSLLRRSWRRCHFSMKCWQLRIRACCTLYYSDTSPGSMQLLQIPDPCTDVLKLPILALGTAATTAEKARKEVWTRQDTEGSIIVFRGNRCNPSGV